MNTQTDSQMKTAAKNFAVFEELTLVEALPARCTPFPKNDADKSEKNLHRATVVGTALVLILVAVLYYFRSASSGKSADNQSLWQIQTITRY
jgi:hypothetical protein